MKESNKRKRATLQKNSMKVFRKKLSIIENPKNKLSIKKVNFQYMMKGYCNYQKF